MNNSTCPRCQDPIRVPESGFLATDRAQCPWCGDEFVLSEVLNQLPPVLKILGNDALGAQEQLATEPVASATWDANSGSNLDVDSFELEDEEFAANETVSMPGQTTTFDTETKTVGRDDLPARPAVLTTPRNKSGGGIKSLLGVVFGGLLAVPLAGAILWGLGLGPFAEGGRFGATTVASKPVEIPNRSYQDKLATPESEPESPDSIEPVRVKTDLVEGSGTVLPDPAARSTLEPAEPATPATPERGLAEVIDSRLTESDELIDTAGKAIEMIRRIDGLDPDAKLPSHWLKVLYSTIAQACDVAKFDGPSIKKLSRSIRGSRIVSDLEFAGADWMDTDKKSNEGALIIGASDGTKVTLPSGKSVSVSSMIPLPDSGRVMILGKITGDDSIDAILMEPF